MAKFRGLGLVINRAAQLLDYGTLIIESMRNVANGFFGLNEDGEAVGPIVGAADTAVNLVGYTPDAGEIVKETDTGRFCDGDGVNKVPNLPCHVVTPMTRDLDVGGYKIFSSNGDIVFELGDYNFYVSETPASNSAGESSFHNFVIGNYHVLGSEIDSNFIFGIGHTVGDEVEQAIIFGSWHVADDFVNSVTIFGREGRASLSSVVTHAAGKFSVAGDAQQTKYLLRGATTNNTPAELTSPGRFTLLDEKSYACTIVVHGRQNTGANHAMYARQCIIQRTGGTVTLAGTVQTIGTDIETDADWDVAITADNTNKSLKITVTGDTSQNVRWVAKIEAVEIGYAD